MQSELTYAELLIELNDVIHEFLLIGSCGQMYAQALDAVTDALIEYLAGAGYALIVLQHAEDIHAKLGVQLIQIVGKELAEDTEVLQRNVVDAAFHMTADLTAGAEGVLMVRQHICEEKVPYVAFEAVQVRQLDQAVQCLVYVFAVSTFDDIAHAIKDFLSRKVPVD